MHWDAGHSNIGNAISRKSEARLVINGNFQNYTIHSSIIFDKMLITPSLYKATKAVIMSCMNLTLIDRRQSELAPSQMNETQTTLLFDDESTENVDIASSSSYDNGAETDTENRTRSTRDVLNHTMVGDTHKYRRTRDAETPSQNEYNATENLSSTPADNTSISDNTTIHYSDTTLTPYPENSTLETSTSEIEETTTISSTDNTSSTNNSTFEVTSSTPPNDVSELDSENVPTREHDTTNYTYNKYFAYVLQSLNMSTSLQKPLHSSLSSLYPSIKNKSFVQHKEIENTIKEVSEQIATNILDFKSVIHEDILRAFCDLTFLISNVEYEVLHNVSKILYQPPRRNEDKGRLAWVVFRDAIAQAGTGPALMLIKEWILYNKITSSEAEDIIGVLPRTVKIPSKQYIDSLFDILKDSHIQKQDSIHVSTLLAFTNILRHVYVDNHNGKALYPAHIFEPLNHNSIRLKLQYLPYLEAQLENSVTKEDSCKVHVYIKALGNVAHPQILNIFKHYFENITKMTTFQKTLLVMSFEKISDLYPEETRNFLYPIYMDENQHYEVRTAAVFQIMETKPPVTILQKMAELTQSESINQVIAAVKTSIQSAAELTNPEDEEFKENAKSVLHLLNSKDLGIHYSYHSFKSHILAHLGNLGYRQSLSYIGSENNIVPKGFFINIERIFGGLNAGKEYYGIMVSDIKKINQILGDLWSGLKRDYGTHAENQSSNEQDKSSPETTGHDRGSQSNKNIPGDKNQPEATMFFHLANAEKIVTFGRNSSSGLENWLEQKLKSLQTGYKLNYTKIFQRDKFVYAAPNAAGFITQFAYRVPTIYHVTGNVMFKNQQSQQSAGTLKAKSQDFVLSGRLNLGYALNKHTDIGFVTPFNGNRYTVGYKEQLLINIPVTVNTTVTSKGQSTKITTKFAPYTNNTMGFYSQFNSQRYRHHDTLDDVVKKQSSGKVRNFETVSSRQIIKEYGGIHLNASVPPIGSEPFPTGRSIYTSLQSTLGLYDKLKYLTNMNIIFKYNFPSDKSSVTFQTLYDSMNNYNTRHNELKPEFSTSQHKSNGHSLKGTNNAINAEWNILFDYEKKPKYMANLNYTWSDFSNKTTFRFALYRISKDEKHSHQPDPMVNFILDSIWSKPPLFNFTTAVANDPNSEFTALLLLGSSKIPTATFQCKLQRTSERRSYLLEQPETKLCKEDMQDGNLILPSCQHAVWNANYLDQHNCTVQVRDLKEDSKFFIFALNALHMTHPNFVSCPRRHSGPSNQISLVTQFAPNFESAKFSLLFPHLETSLKDVSIHPILRPIVGIHPSHSAITRTAQTLLKNQYNPMCALDKTKLNTFDNQTYTVNLGSCWYVLMALTLRNVANPNLSKNDVLILVRDSYEGRVLRMLVGDNVVDITTQELNKQTSFKYIYVNNKQYRLSNDQYSNIVLNDPNNIYLHGGIVDENIQLHFSSFSIIFDGIRVLLVTSNSFRNQTLGLCGTFTGEESDDFTLPKHCNVDTQNQFTTSYAIINNNTCSGKALEWANEATKKSCSLTGDIYMHSKFPKVASCHNDSYKEADPRCMTRYNQVLQVQTQTCFSQHALPKCKEYCYPIKMVTKNVKFHCVDTALISKQFVARVQSGKLHDFSKKQKKKTISMEVPSGCYKC